MTLKILELFGGIGAPHKHATPVEDLRKAATYLDFAIKAETRRAT